MFIDEVFEKQYQSYKKKRQYDSDFYKNKKGIDKTLLETLKEENLQLSTQIVQLKSDNEYFKLHLQKFLA